MSSPSDIFFLKQALKLAKKGLSWTNPNPLVGAVIVNQGKIIGRGFHRAIGLPHAEIEALKKAKTNIKGSTLYVNLEPCIHFGKTPPCVKAIINSGIKRVVCSTLDPNPKVNGQGLAKLKKAGIEVNIDLLENEARSLNEAFFTFHQKKRPFIAIKFAASLDGKIASRSGDSKWITNEKAREFVVNRLWPSYQAVLVGINTVIRDNEPMKIENHNYKNPLRIVLDSHLRIPLKSNFLWDNNVVIITTQFANQDKYKELIKMGMKIITTEADNDKVSVKNLVEELSKREIISILVEGGGKVLGSFIDEKLVDKVYAFLAPLIIGGEKAISAVTGHGTETIKQAIRLKNVTFKRFGDNLLNIGYV